MKKRDRGPVCRQALNRAGTGQAGGFRD